MTGPHLGDLPLPSRETVQFLLLIGWDIAYPYRMRVSAVILLMLSAPLLAEESPSFEGDIKPLLQRRCLSCHNDADHKGDFSLQTRQSAFESNVVPGDPAASYLLDLVSSTTADERMPPEGEPLSSIEIDLVRRWIAGGAHWPDGERIEEPVVTDTDWWSLRPLTRPSLPVEAASPVDWFVAQRLQAAGMTGTAEADRRTLVRRLSFDLIGLPPTPDEVEAFVSDPNPNAYEKLVDRLLASPHYGERWARHWLDIVHFGETHGYDKDKPRPNAWPYRDYVIHALNNDIPYHEFIEQQLAGDILYPDTAAGIEALGFISAGPWDFIGHAEVPETKIDGKIARHLDRDDMVQNTLTTFCSVTVGCAQCHNHKFDPITQADYYSLHAVFAAVDRADRKYDRDPQTAARRRELLSVQMGLEADLQEVRLDIADYAGDALKDIAAQFAALREQKPTRPPQHGYHSQIEKESDRTKWVQVDLGSSALFNRIELYPCHDDFNGIGEGFGFPVRYKIECSAAEDFSSDVTLLFDWTRSDAENPRLRTKVIDLKGANGRFVRVTATRLAPRQNDFILALSELKVFNEQGENIAAGKPVTSLDSIEAPIRWGRANLTDGIYPTSGYAEAEWLALEKRQNDLLRELVPADILAEERELNVRLQQLDSELKALPAQQTVYVGTVHTGQGSFRGTGNEGGRPREIRVLHRGDVKNPGELAPPGTLSCLPELASRFDMPPDAPEGARRAALAMWIADSRNPLTWRSIVNRVWQYHFGRGLVETAGDFGRMGSLPSHPELLDYLAADFRDGGQSLKSLHKVIVMSAVYRQSSAHPDEHQYVAQDAENRLLWKYPSRRHDAEVLRDSMLAASGLLNPAMGGPSFQDFVVEHPEHSPHYEYHLYNPRDPQSHRRSIYRFLVRSKTQPFMTVMDCADPSLQVDRRTETISPLQALALLNDGLVLVCSEALAKRAEECSANPPDQIDQMFQWTLNRLPSDPERQILADIQQRDGNIAVARIMFNLNEFAFLD